MLIDKLRAALEYRKSGMASEDIEDEVLLDNPSDSDALDMWISLVIVFGGRQLSRCLRYKRKRYYPLAFIHLFEYAVDSGEVLWAHIKERFYSILDSEEFEEISKDPIFLI